MHHYRQQGPKKKPRGKAFPKGNKLGGRKKLPPEIKAAFETMLPDAMEALNQIVKSKKHNRREQAAEYICNRVGGTPSATNKLEMTGPNGEPLNNGPMQISVQFVTTPMSLGKAQITHIGPDGKPIEVHEPIDESQIESNPPQDYNKKKPG